MAHPQFATIDFSKFEEAEFSPAVHRIITSLTTNALTFPALPVSVATMTTHVTTYDKVLGLPVYPTRTADLAAARKALNTDLKANGVYVNSIANGDVVKIGLSGFPISKEHAPVGPLPQSQIAATSTSGGFDFVITPAVEVAEQKVIPNAHGYLIFYFDLTSPTAPPADFQQWPSAYLPKHTGSVTGLKPSNPYRLVSAALGTDANLVFSNPVDRTTQ